MEPSPGKRQGRTIQSRVQRQLGARLNGQPSAAAAVLEHERVLAAAAVVAQKHAARWTCCELFVSNSNCKQPALVLQHESQRPRASPRGAIASTISSLLTRLPLLYCPCHSTHKRYEDNFDAVNNVMVSSVPTDKGDISGYGTPDKFLEQVSYLFGRQTFAGAFAVVVCLVGRAAARLPCCWHLARSHTPAHARTHRPHTRDDTQARRGLRVALPPTA